MIHPIKRMGKKYILDSGERNIGRRNAIVKKLAISFITFNRAKHIKEDLDRIVKPTKDLNIDIYIYDGSTNLHTKYVVNNFLNNGYDHIHYFHIENTIADSVTQRLSKALFEPDAEYVWLCGDKFVINPNYYNEILSYIDKSYDIITIYEKILKGTREFEDVSGFADYAIVPVTQFGSTIIKKKLIELYSIKKARKNIAAFGVQFIFLLAIGNCKIFKGVVIDGGEQATVLSKFLTRSGSLSSMWNSWIKDWYKFIDLLPDAYNSVKEGLYNRPDLQMGFFSIKELLRQRSEEQFDWKKFIEYRKFVKKVIVLPSIIVFGIAILPKGLAGYLYKIKK